MSDASSSSWQSDPLLARSSPRAPNFVRMHWDEQSSQAFGPWRLKEKPDPTEGLSEPARPISPQKAENGADEALDSTASEIADGDQALTDPAESDISGSEEPALHEAAAPTAPMSGAPTNGPASPATGYTEQHLHVARQQGYVQGIKDGMAKAAGDTESERQKEREVIRALSIELRSLGQAPERYFEPIRRLALHIAEQLVRGELTVAGHAVDRLVRSALEDLGSRDTAAVVTLHPDDLQRLQQLSAPTQSEIRFEPDSTLLPGSVRVRANDTEIQDFIEHRLEALARRLLNNPEAWLSQSSMLKNPTVEEVPASMPGRSWRHRSVDIQDTQEKVPARTESSTEAETAVTDPASPEQQVQDLPPVPVPDAEPSAPSAGAMADTGKSES